MVTSAGGRPDWRLVPLAPADDGTRRAVPRYDVALPAVLVVDEVRLAGETVDISVAGVRLGFPPADPATHPLPAPGTVGELAVLIEGERTAVPVSVVRSGLLPDGTRDVRVYLTGDLDDERRRLRDFVLAASRRRRRRPPRSARRGRPGSVERGAGQRLVGGHVALPGRRDHVVGELRGRGLPVPPRRGQPVPHVLLVVGGLHRTG